MQASLVTVMLCILLSPADGLGAQDKQQEDVYLIDLGIIIEPGDHDSTAQLDSLPGLDDVELLMGKEPPGAAFIESTKELRAVLDNLGGKIDDLESSLNQDVDAVRLENERLRSLIRKIQVSRKEAEVMESVVNAPVEEGSTPTAAPRLSLPKNPSYHHVLQAYRAGLFEDVVLLSQALDESTLGPRESFQVAYWCADAYFRRGEFDKALLKLEKVPASDPDLGDDVIILQGLIFLRQGKPREALARFQTIVSQYPASEYQRLAELTIKELNDQ